MCDLSKNSTPEWQLQHQVLVDSILQLSAFGQDATDPSHSGHVSIYPHTAMEIHPRSKMSLNSNCCLRRQVIFRTASRWLVTRFSCAPPERRGILASRISRKQNGSQVEKQERASLIAASTSRRLPPRLPVGDLLSPLPLHPSKYDALSYGHQEPCWMDVYRFRRIPEVTFVDASIYVRHSSLPYQTTRRI